MPLIPSLFAIGSCRILTPLSLLEADNKITLRNNGVPWLTHSTKDTIQKIQIVRGELRVADEQKCWLSPEPHKNTPERALSSSLELADCAVIEISSVKTFTCDGIEVQQWYWQNLVKDAGVDMDAFINTVSKPLHLRDLLFLPDNAQDEVLIFATRGMFHIQTEEEITNDLAQINELSKRPLILVPPINVPLENGLYLNDRRMLCDAIRTYCKKSGHYYFNQNSFIETFGADRALLDLGHYTKEFLPILTEQMMRAIHLRLSYQAL